MHNPEKSKTLCLIAEGSYWTLTIFGWFAFVSMLIAAAIGLIIKAYQNWSWSGIGKVLLALLLVSIFLVMPAVLLAGLHEWAKKYRQDC
jgi:hypothetical protein